MQTPKASSLTPFSSSENHSKWRTNVSESGETPVPRLKQSRTKMMSKCRKCHLRETKFAKFPGGACTQTPLEARAVGARLSAFGAKRASLLISPQKGWNVCSQQVGEWPSSSQQSKKSNHESTHSVHPLAYRHKQRYTPRCLDIYATLIRVVALSQHK